MKTRNLQMMLLGFVVVVMNAVNVSSQNVLTHNTGTLTVSVLDNGNIGHDNTTFSQGSGVHFLGAADVMFTSGILLGYNGTVSGQVFYNDMRTVTPYSGFTSDFHFDQIASCVISDSVAPSPLGLRIEEGSMSHAGDDFIYVSYHVVNNTGSAINSLYVGNFADWDVNGGGSNRGGYDVSRGLAYMYQTGFAYYGIVGMSGMAGARVSQNNASDGDRDSAYSRISNFFGETPPSDVDLRIYYGSGPFNIPDGSSVDVAFAVVAGATLSDLQSNCDLAVSKWTLIHNAGLNAVTHNTGTLQASVLDNGNFGHDNTTFSLGNGVRFMDASDVMFTSGILLGHHNTISGMILNIKDMKRVEPLSGFTSDEHFDQISTCMISDSAAPLPVGLEILQSSLSKSGQDFVYLKYSLTNNSGSDVMNLYVGNFADWDINGGLSNRGGYDMSRGLAYMYQTDFAYYGIVGMSGLAGARVSQNSASDGNRDSAYSRISNFFDETPPTNTDLRIYYGSGPFNIPNGSSIDVAFAIVAGTSLSDIQANADTAVAYWNSIVSVSDNDHIPKAARLLQNFPNPFNPLTTISYELASDSYVSLAVYNLLGQEVRSMVDGLIPRGSRFATWDGRDNAGHQVSSGVYVYRLTARSVDGKEKFAQSRKMLMLK